MDCATGAAAGALQPIDTKIMFVTSAGPHLGALHRASGRANPTSARASSAKQDMNHAQLKRGRVDTTQPQHSRGAATQSKMGAKRSSACASGARVCLCFCWVLDPRACGAHIVRDTHTHTFARAQPYLCAHTVNNTESAQKNKEERRASELVQAHQITCSRFAFCWCAHTNAYRTIPYIYICIL